MAAQLSDQMPRCVSRVRCAQNKYLLLQVVVPGLAVCVYDFSMFVNALKIQELFLVCGQRFSEKKSVVYSLSQQASE